MRDQTPSETEIDAALARIWERVQAQIAAPGDSD
jgi:hypothetical protein